MQDIAGNTPLGSVFGHRSRQIVPAIILLYPYAEYKWILKVSFDGDMIFKVFLLWIFFAFILSFLTEMIGDWVEGRIFNKLSSYNCQCFRNNDDVNGVSIADNWFKYLNRSLEDKRIADMYISGRVDILKLQCALPIPILFSMMGIVCVKELEIWKEMVIVLVGFFFIFLFIYFAFTTMKELIRLRDNVVSQLSNV